MSGKLSVVPRAGMFSVPEKPLGLYDPAFDKDSCGVRFVVAELSGDCSRKTVQYEAWLRCMVWEFFQHLMMSPNRAFDDFIASSGITDEMPGIFIVLKNFEGIKGLPPFKGKRRQVFGKDW